MDYESEEEEVAEEEEEHKEDQCDPVEENAEEESLQGSQPEVTHVPGPRRTKKRRETGKRVGDLAQTRVNAVLQSNPAIQRYCFDQQQELWCEVGIAAKLFILRHVEGVTIITEGNSDEL